MAANKVIVNKEPIIDLTADTVTAAALRKGVTAHDQSGAQITGTMENSSQSTLLEIDSAGLVSAKVTQSGGYVDSGTKTATMQLSTQAAKTVTPTESEQTAVVARRYTTGAVIVGAIPTTYVGSGIARKSSSDLTASGATVTVPAGYYESAASKSVATATQATPSISVSAAGLITASATQTAGYVSSGTKSATKQLTTQAAKTITPSTAQQTAVSSGVYTTGAVIVSAVPTETKTVALSMLTGNQTISRTSGKFMTSVTVQKPASMIPSNIKKGITIGGVSGAYEKQIWIFPATISVTELLINGADTEYEISFTSAGNPYTKLKATTTNKLYYYNPVDEYYETIYDQSKTAKWTQQTNRKIVLQETPSSSFLTHLQKVATKQTAEDVAVQTALNQEQISSNGTYTYSPTAPYDALAGVTVRVAVSSSGVDLPFTKLGTVTTDDGVISIKTTGTLYKTLIAVRTNSAGGKYILTAISAGATGTKASIVAGSKDSVSTSNFAVNLSSGTYTYTWTLTDESDSAWYDGTFDIYGAT